jgi:hypothetical protein
MSDQCLCFGTIRLFASDCLSRYIRMNDSTIDHRLDFGNRVTKIDIIVLHSDIVRFDVLISVLIWRIDTRQKASFILVLSTVSVSKFISDMEGFTNRTGVVSRRKNVKRDVDAIQSNIYRHFF